jgi:glycosyltransferase involved in cell wall biosynthesis
MRISVVMPVCLTPYAQYGNTCATNPEEKFVRAVNSFLSQEFKDAELVIISDGCLRAQRLHNIHFVDMPNVQFKLIDKQVLFSGVVRNTGIELAQGELICYLDHDDMFGPRHLLTINNNFNTISYDWCYYNDLLVTDANFNVIERNVSPHPCWIGTSCIVHKKTIGVRWTDGYGHDWELIKNYLFNRRPGIKIPTPQYYVCHAPGTCDF